MNTRMPLPAIATTFAAVLLLGLCLFGPLPVEAVPAASCSASDKEPRDLTCDFALELWEEGKKSDGIFQLWNLWCNASVGGGPRCDLERTQVLIVKPLGGTAEVIADVKIHRHSTSNQTLKLRELDWANRSLSFDVVYRGGERMPVVIKLKPLF